jgi:hypothetical protein
VGVEFFRRALNVGFVRRSLQGMTAGEGSQGECALPWKSLQQFPQHWRRVASLPQPLTAMDMCAGPEALQLPYSPAIACAELDPLDPAFLAAINDPCCARKVQAGAAILAFSAECSVPSLEVSSSLVAGLVLAGTVRHLVHMF